MRKLTESGVDKPEKAAVPVCIVDISRTDEGQGFAVDFYMGGVRLDEAAKPTYYAPASVARASS